MSQSPSPQAAQAFKQALSAIEQSNWNAAKQLVEPHQKEAVLSWTGSVAMGFICVQESRFDLAKQYFSQAIQHDSNHPIAIFQLGEVLRFTGNPYDALGYLNHLIKQFPNHLQGIVSLGKTLYALDKIDMAIECYKQAQALSPNHDELNIHLANAYDSLSDTENAEHYFRESFRQDPDNTLLLYTYIANRKGKVSDDIVERTHALHKRLNTLPPSEHSHICYAMALLSEAKKDLAAAFNFYKQANDNELSIHGYDGADFTYLENIQQTYTAATLERLKGHGNSSDQPIFIVGMPRSGTTLTGQILASHSDVEMAGELSIMHMLTQNSMQQLTEQPYPASALQITPEDCDTLGAFYVQALSTHGNTPHIIDKMPSNMIHIGLIRSMLPNAKIIYCKRHPVDVCWSIYRQYFGMHHYRHDLKDLAKMYAKAEKIMNYWLEVYPNDIHTVQYENVIDDTETNARALIDFCGLEWQGACLEFHKSKTKVRTASIQQVRQPIYKTSLTSWEPIKDQLQPLIDTLLEEGIEV